MGIFSKAMSKPTEPERDAYLGALLDLYQQLDEVDPENTKNWIKVAQLNDKVTTQGYEFRDTFGKTEYMSVIKEAMYVDSLRRERARQRSIAN